MLNVLIMQARVGGVDGVGGVVGVVELPSSPDTQFSVLNSSEL